jgi:hypothetical protein
LPDQNVMLKRILAIALGLAGSTIPAAAQMRSFAGCWLRPAPAPTCSGFIVTEASAEFSLNKRENQADPRFVLGVGFMHSVDAASSMGGVVGWDVGRGWATPARGELRYRRWLTTGAVDFAGGIAQRGVTASDGSGREVRAYGPTVMTGYEWKYVAVDARAELLRGDNRTFTDSYLGARTTSAGAPIAVLAGLALIVAVVSQANY